MSGARRRLPGKPGRALVGESGLLRGEQKQATGAALGDARKAGVRCVGLGPDLVTPQIPMLQVCTGSGLCPSDQLPRCSPLAHGQQVRSPKEGWQSEEAPPGPRPGGGAFSLEVAMCFPDSKTNQDLY